MSSSSEPPVSREPSAQTQIDQELPIWIEVGVVGGLGLVIFYGPTVLQTIRNTVTVVGPRVKRVVAETCSSVARRWKPLCRRRRNGSIVRVIGSILPDSCFSPTCRIFIQMSESNSDDQRRRAEFMFGEENTVLGRTFRGDEVDADENDNAGLIVAFHLDTDSESLFSAEGDDIQDVSSNPEGWENENCTVPIFNPRACSTQMVCSTPQPPGSYSRRYFDSITTDCDEVNEKMNGQQRQDELQLKNMVQQLMIQVHTLNQNLSQNKPYETSHQTLTLHEINNLPPPPPMSPILGAVAPIPPPPPPPPMPTAPLPRLQPQFKRNQNNLTSTKKAVPSLMDVLKDLPNVQLRPVPRSPGGTAVKREKLENRSETLTKTTAVPTMSDVLKDLPTVILRPVDRSPGGTPVKRKKLGNQPEDIGALMKNALLQRFDCMHGDSDNESEEKENDFEDSIESENPQSQYKNKNALYQSNDISGKPIMSPGNINSAEKKPIRRLEVPFGQHMLKKRNQTGDSPDETNNRRPVVLGEKNN